MEQPYIPEGYGYYGRMARIRAIDAVMRGHGETTGEYYMALYAYDERLGNKAKKFGYMMEVLSGGFVKFTKL